MDCRILLAAVALIIALPAAHAQQSAPPAQPALDPAQAAARAAYDRLDEAERKAIQNDLIWTGDFNGVAGGEFGRRTYDAILAFERKTRATADGILTPPERAALKTQADAARSAMRFAEVTDQTTGIRIGLPQAMLTQRVVVDGGVVYRRQDAQVSLQLTTPPTQPLPELFERLRQDGPNRKVTYRLQRPDWFVVSGEEGARKFYTRVAQGPQGLRAYTFRYPAAESATMDRLMIAIANTFEPFPGRAIAANPSRSPALPAGPAGNAPPPLVQPTLTSAEARFALSGVVIASGKVLTSAVALRSCAEPAIAGQAIAPAAVAAAGELAVITASTGNQPAMPLASGHSDHIFTLSFEDAAQRVPVISPGVAEGGTVRSALQVGPGGAPIVDGQGRLIGMVRESARAVRMVAGTAPVAAYAMIGPQAISGALSQGGITPPTAAAQRTLAQAAASLVEIRCTRRM